MLKKRHPGSEDLPEDMLKLVRHIIEAGVHHPMYYIEGIEPASDPDSDSEPDVVVDAVYDILCKYLYCSIAFLSLAHNDLRYPNDGHY